jgi:hypothetical protein
VRSHFNDGFAEGEARAGEHDALDDPRSPEQDWTVARERFDVDSARRHGELRVSRLHARVGEGESCAQRCADREWLSLCPNGGNAARVDPSNDRDLQLSMIHALLTMWVVGERRSLRAAVSETTSTAASFRCLAFALDIGVNGLSAMTR